ncbi:MAG: threonine synthase, partial [Lachnospiraceae bacterium]|nr:threonine synthase [Lachnospiraceae bacterium]
PFKFTRAVAGAVGIETEGADDVALAKTLSQTTGVPTPEAVTSLQTAPVRHERVCETGEMAQAVRDFPRV